MLDENLPTFYTKPSSDNHLFSTLFLSHNGSELQPEYTLRRPDPNLQVSKNCYGLALYDSYNQDVLYAEVLVQPEWTQPTLSPAEIRALGGMPAPPVPIVPNSFTIQLYNPDQQVIIKQIAGSWNSSAYWEFEMPQNTFRLPSASSLDRSQDDPAASTVTTKITFKWKRDGKLTKDLSCYLVGKSTDGRKSREPDITVAMYKGGKDLTIYQPNIHRVDVEDAKGLEVVFLLSSAVIKDIYFNANRELFNISSQAPSAGRARRKSSGPVLAISKPGNTSPVMSGAVLTSPTSYIPPQQISGGRHPQPNLQTQWEIDAETARLKALVEAEDRERERAVLEEEERLKRMFQAEEKEQKRRDAEVAKETERLRRQYGIPAAGNSHQTVQFSAVPPTPPRPGGFPQHQSAPHSVPPPVQRPVSTPGGAHSYNNGSSWEPSASLQQPQQGPSPYLQAPGNGTASSSGFFGRGNKVTKKRSVFF